MKGALLGRNFTFCCQAKMSNKGCSAASLALAVCEEQMEGNDESKILQFILIMCSVRQ